MIVFFATSERIHEYGRSVLPNATPLLIAQNPQLEANKSNRVRTIDAFSDVLILLFVPVLVLVLLRVA